MGIAFFLSHIYLNVDTNCLEEPKVLMGGEKIKKEGDHRISSKYIIYLHETGLI